MAQFFNKYYIFQFITKFNVGQVYSYFAAAIISTSISAYGQQDARVCINRTLSVQTSFIHILRFSTISFVNIFLE